MLWGHQTNAPSKLASAIGAELSALDAVVLTGGKKRDGWAVKNAALVKATRWVSIMGQPEPSKPSVRAVCDGDATKVEFQTSWTSYQRDILTGQVPDALIALKGGAGTLAEVACALIAERPVVFVGGQSAFPDEVDLAELKTIYTDIRALWGGVPDFETYLAHYTGPSNFAFTAPAAAAKAVELGESRKGKWDWTSSVVSDQGLLNTFKSKLSALCQPPP